MESLSGRQVDVFVKQEKPKMQWKEDSLWHKLKKGPLASTLYAMTLYPRVLFNRHVSKSSHHPSLTVYQETAIRTIRRSLNSSLSTARNNSAFIESPLKVSRCSEPIEPVVDATGVKGRWLGAKTWKGRQAQAILLHVHGMGHVSSSLSGIQSLCYLLKILRAKHNVHIRALIIDYALAPEDPYPGGLNDVEQAYRWLAMSGISGSQNIFLCGTSAGGALILALLQGLYSYLDTATSALPRPLGAILISPWVEVSCKSSSYFTNSKFDIQTAYFCQLAAENYLFGKKDDPITKKPLEESADVQKDQKEIIEWLEGIENAFNTINYDKRNVLNNEKRNLEWKHEVVSVKRHSGEGITSNKKKRNSRSSRTSRKSRTSRCSRTLQYIEVVKTTETNKYRESVDGAYSTLTSKHITVTRQQDDRQDGVKLVKRDSIVRFSDSLEIHTQADLNEITNIKRGSWIRKSFEPHRVIDDPENVPKVDPCSRPSSIIVADVKAITSPLTPPQTKDKSNDLNAIKEKRLGFDMPDKVPFANSLISMLDIPQNLLAKFPPLFISYGGREIFKDDIEMFCQKCVRSKDAGISGKSEKDLVETHPDVIIESDKNMVHSYPMLLGVFGKHSKEALTKIATFLNTRLPASSPPPPILLTASNIKSPNDTINDSNMHAHQSFKPSGNSRRRKLKRRPPPISISSATKDLNFNVVGKKFKTNADVLTTKNIVSITPETKAPTNSIAHSSPRESLTFPIISSSSIFIPYSYPEPGFLEHLSSQKRLSLDPIISENEKPQRFSTYSAGSKQIRDSDQSRKLRLSIASKTSVCSYVDIEGKIIPNSRRLSTVCPVTIIEK